MIQRFKAYLRLRAAKKDLARAQAEYAYELGRRMRLDQQER